MKTIRYVSQTGASPNGRPWCRTRAFQRGFRGRRGTISGQLLKASTLPTAGHPKMGISTKSDGHGFNPARRKMRCSGCTEATLTTRLRNQGSSSKSDTVPIRHPPFADGTCAAANCRTEAARRRPGYRARAAVEPGSHTRHPSAPGRNGLSASGTSIRSPTRARD